MNKRHPEHGEGPLRPYGANDDVKYGEVSERSMVQPWKGCVAQVTEGSNPSLSAITNIEGGFCPLLYL